MPELRRVDAQYRVSLPEAVREALGLEPDGFVSFEVQGDKTVKLRRARVTFD